MVKITTKRKFYANQEGVVSILVSVIIMIILTLIAVGFAQLMRREQRQALDRQLSAQAYYAAESAINDAAYAFSQNLIDPSKYNTCQAPAGEALSENVISGELIVSYSCVTLSTVIESIEYDAIGVADTKQTQINPVTSAGLQGNLNSLTIAWEGAAELNFLTGFNASNPLFPAFSAWTFDRPSVLRLEIIPLKNRGGDIIKRNDLLDSTNIDGRKVFFLYPNEDISGGVSATPVDVDWDDLTTTFSGMVVPGNCDPLDTTRRKDCQIRITDLPVPNGYSYIVRIKSLYKNTSVSIAGELDSGPSSFYGSQIVIDATGKANDVLRRVRANVSIEEDFPIPEYLVQSYDGVCKQLSIIDNLSYNCPN